MDDNTYDFDMAKAPQTIIKVIGVGGGGGNAVSNMYREGIRDVSFVLCNTDNQALQKSEVPDKLLIGRNTTNGLGSGNVPERGEAAAIESEKEIHDMLDDGTRMAFVTAGRRNRYGGRPDRCQDFQRYGNPYRRYRYDPLRL